MSTRKPIRVRVTAVIELDADAQDAWSSSFGVENTPAALREDVRTYFTNGMANEPVLGETGARVIR